MRVSLAERRDGDREEETHRGMEGIWRRVRWREEPQYERLREGREEEEGRRESLHPSLLLPTFQLQCDMLKM